MKELKFFTLFLLAVPYGSLSLNPKEKPGRNVWGTLWWNHSLSTTVHWLPAVVRWTFATIPMRVWYWGELFHKDKFDVKAIFQNIQQRILWLQPGSFLKVRVQRLLARPSLTNPRHFNYYEIGGLSYKDFDQDSKTENGIYKRALGEILGGTVPLHAEIPCKVRKIMVRDGCHYLEQFADLSRALSHQGLTNGDLKNIKQRRIDHYL